MPCFLHFFRFTHRSFLEDLLPTQAWVLLVDELLVAHSRLDAFIAFMHACRLGAGAMQVRETIPE
jgi:hypothetical protein